MSISFNENNEKYFAGVDQFIVYKVLWENKFNIVPIDDQSRAVGTEFGTIKKLLELCQTKKNNGKALPDIRFEISHSQGLRAVTEMFQGLCRKKYVPSEVYSKLSPPNVFEAIKDTQL